MSSGSHIQLLTFKKYRGERSMLQDSTEVPSTNSGKLCKTNDLVSSTDTRRKNRDAKKLQIKRAAAAKWRLLSEPSFHQQTLYPPQDVCPHSPKVLVSGIHEPQQKHRPYVGVPAAASQVRGALTITPGPTLKVHFQGHLLIHTGALSFLQPHYTELYVLSLYPNT